MRKIVFLTVLAVATATIACNTQQQNNSSQNNADSIQVESQISIGEPVDEKAAISLASLASNMEDETLMEGLTVKGTVTEVCQNKGCWMKLEKENGETMRVTFKDYALFMPKDIAGKSVVISGKAYMDTITVDALKHFAEDAGKTQDQIEAINEKEIALVFEADGVLIEE